MGRNKLTMCRIGLLINSGNVSDSGPPVFISLVKRRRLFGNQRDVDTGCNLMERTRFMRKCRGEGKKHE